MSNPSESTPKKCFSCLTVVDSDCRKCPKCGKGSFYRKIEKTTVAKSDIPIPGEDGWRAEDAHVGAEKVLQKVCADRLSLLGVRHAVHIRPGQKTCDGLADLIFCYRGIPFAVELKQKTGRIDDAQRDCLADMMADGWNVRVCYSLSQFDSFIQEVVKAKGSENEPYSEPYQVPQVRSGD